MSDIYTATKLHDNFWQIAEGSVRCFLCIGHEKAMLVDSGYGRGDLKAFAATITDKPVFLVNSHGDGDHVGGNDFFGEALMHPAEFAYYKMKNPTKAANLLPLWEGEIIDLGTMKFEVIHIPGHTPGSIALLDRENKRLIGGDSIQKGNILMCGQGRDFDAYIASMERLKAMEGAFEAVYAAHNRTDVDFSVLDDLIEGAKLLLKGKLDGVESGRADGSKIYRFKDSGFYY